MRIHLAIMVVKMSTRNLQFPVPCALRSKPLPQNRQHRQDLIANATTHEVVSFQRKLLALSVAILFAFSTLVLKFSPIPMVGAFLRSRCCLFNRLHLLAKLFIPRESSGPYVDHTSRVREACGDIQLLLGIVVARLPAFSCPRPRSFDYNVDRVTVDAPGCS